MDDLGIARARRAHDLLTDALADTPAPVPDDRHAKAQAFSELALCVAKGFEPEGIRAEIEASGNTLVRKAAAGGFGLSDGTGWLNSDLAALAAAYVQSIAELSLLDAMAKYATVLPTAARKVLIASDAVAHVTPESLPKPIVRPTMSVGDAEPLKAAGIVVASLELLRTGGEAARQMFERELRESVVRACNEAVLLELTDSNTIPVLGSGDALANLRAGIRAAGPSNGFVIAASTADVQDLATRHEAGPTFTVRGVEFRPGVHVIALDGIHDMHVIPASRVALRDWGLVLRSAEHADVILRTNPEDEGTVSCLWQSNMSAILAERMFLLGGDAQMVVVEAGSP